MGRPDAYLAGADEINLPAGTFTLTIPGQGEGAAATGDLNVTDELVISGAGAALTTIDAARLDRTVAVENVRLFTIQNLAIVNGDSFTLAGSAVGAISSTIVIQRCLIRDCTDVGVFLGLCSASIDTTIITGTVGGVAIEAQTSTLDISASELSDNGRAINATFSSVVTVTSSRLANNAGGGALWLPRSSVTLNNCLVAGNHAILQGGAAYLTQGASLIARDTLFEDNTVGDAGGPLNPGGAIYIQNGIAVVERCTFRNNSCVSYGGAIAVGNANEIGSLTAIDCVFEGNHADLGGGGIAVRGTDFSSNPRNLATLTSSTFSRNTSGGAGGAILVETGGSSGDAYLTNCTLTANTATDGGALFAGQRTTRGQVRLAQCTIVDNIATDHAALAGGVSAGTPSDVALGGCIVSGNTRAGSPSDLGGPLTSLGYNLIGTTSGATLSGDLATNLEGVDPLLGPSQDNGGTTPTRAPSPMSPAIDSSDPGGSLDALGAPLTIDQRGVARPVDGDGDLTPRDDIGAVELDCGADSDGDTIGDNCDCAPADPGSFALPAEPTVQVGKPASSTDALVAWSDLVANAGPATVADVASGTLQALLVVARVADGPCVATGVVGTSWRDVRAVVPGEWGFYYLVRGVNACGPAARQGWGADSFGVDRPACP